MSNKLSVSVICGGQSCEHAVSLSSARFIVKNLNPERYNVSVVIVSQQGEWFLLNDSNSLFQNERDFATCAQRIMPAIGVSNATWQSVDGKQHFLVDAVFPIIHGTSGEDGTLQGILRWLNVAFVGPDVLASALCMDKWAAKKMLDAEGIQTAPWCGLTREHWQQGDLPEALLDLNFPLFVKPADLGSSVGVSKVKNKAELDVALAHAFSFSHRVIIEKAIEGREIECAILGNHVAKASIPGELVVHSEFYDYNAKYIADDAARIELPAQLSDAIEKKVQGIALKAYQILSCEGMARVDCFVAGDNVIVNEVNTLPGFTDISMYPKMWAHMGVNAKALLDQLLILARKRHQQYQQNLTVHASNDLSEQQA